MKRIYIPTASPQDWQRFLTEPEKQWRSGYSARELAIAWEKANGFPSEFQAGFKKIADANLQNLEMLLAIPEYQVALPGGGRASQNDLFVLARTENQGLVAMMVEGKVAEPFGPKLSKWLQNASKGKQQRLKYLCAELGLPDQLPGEIGYQLLHRTASAIIEAKRFNARYGMMIVHSFSAAHKWFEDYQAFLKLFGITGAVNEVVKLAERESVSIYVGWVVGKIQAG